MQKKMMVAAVTAALGAPTGALAQAEIYGFVHMSVNRVKYSESASGAPAVSKLDVAHHSSNYGIRGRESLGGGLTAWFQIEQNTPMERSNNIAITPASRNSAVGMQGAWGNLFLGQWTTPWSDLESLWSVGTAGGWGPTTSIIGRRETTGTAPNPNCSNGHLSPSVGICDAVESAGGVGHPFWRRFSQAVYYQSPVFSGTQVKAAYMTNDTKATAGTVNANPSAWSTSVQWAGLAGRLRGGLAYDGHRDFTTIGQTDTGWKIVGGWNFGFADLGGVIERMTYKTTAGDTQARQYGVALSVPAGGGAIKGAYSVARDLSGGTGAGDNGAKQYNLGYEHRFSKRTNMGFGYAKIANDPAAVFTWTGMPPNQQGVSTTPLPGSDPSTVFVSLMHRF